MSIVKRIQETYSTLDAHSIQAGALGKLYDDNAVLIDPLHRLEGLPSIERYMLSMYRNAAKVSFEYLSVWEREGEATLRWEMEFSHPKLKQGRFIVVPGMTYVQFNERITWHQDYFDSNHMIFDHVPVLGSILGWLKGRLN